MFETLRSDTPQPVPFDNETGLAIIYNPTNKEAVQHAYGLREYAEYLWPNKLKKPRIIYVESEPSVEANAEMLASLEKDGKWHYSIHGGDGTYHNVLLAADKIIAKGIFVTVANGNACDLAHSLHTKFYQQDPINALVYGNTGKLRTLDITIETPDGDSFDYQAISYAGFGLSGLAAYQLNNPDYRRKSSNLSKLERRMEETKLVWNLSKSAEAFEASNYGDNPRRIIEHSYIGIDHMAKLPFGSKANIFSRQAIIGELHSRDFKDIAQGIGKAALGIPRIRPGQTDITTVYYENQEAFFMQLDGDHLLVPNGSTIRIEKNPDAKVKVVHTRRIPIS